MIAKIVLFEHTNLSGKSITLSNAGNIDETFNDKVSSIVVVKGTWSLYKDRNFSGTRWEVRANGGPDGDGVYPSYKDWHGENDKLSSLVVERGSWMEDTTEIHEKKLRNICLPASHDSGTFDLSDIWTPAISEELSLAMNTLNSIADDIEDIDFIGDYIPNPAEWLIEAITPTVRDLATATGRDLAQQLRDGIRCMDFRIYYDASDQQFYIVHTLRGPKIVDLLEDVATFLSSHSGEIVYLTFSHIAGLGNSPEKEQHLADFLNLVKDRLRDRAYRVETQNNQIVNNPFERTYNQIINSPTEANQRDSGKKGHPSNSVVILVTDVYSTDGYKDDPAESTQDKFFWPVQYCPPHWKNDMPALYGFYTNTSDKNAAINGQMTNQATARELDLPFPLYMTLTPQEEECEMIVVYGAKDAIAQMGATLIISLNPVTAAVGAALVALAISLELTESMLPYKSLKELSSHINNDLYSNVKKTFGTQSPNDVSIIYVDFYENTTNLDLVDLAIELSYH